MCRKLFILFITLVGFMAASAQADKAEENYEAGRKLRRDGKCTEAIPLFKKAIEQKPTLAAAHYELGWCYNELGQYNIALPILQQAVKLEPTGFRSLYEAGFAKYKLGRVEEALVDFNQVVKLNANYEKVYIARGDLYK
ncbi:MAG: tetratricopeptide repeat protein, partial [Lacibacter sp.]|nr:tetratricopeptide repeat protein [Lacibacter sp.]